MKTTLQNESGIILLKRTAKLQANSLYFLVSESSARSLYFRNRNNIEGMHLKIKQHMLPVMDILDYMFVGKGVILMIRTKSEQTIIDYYTRMQKAKRKAIRFDKASEILSEQIRFAISASVSRTNRQNGSNGTIVHSNFDRAIISDLDSAKRLMQKMRTQQIKLCRQKRQFKANFKYWNKDKLLDVDGDVYLCTKKKWDGEVIQEKFKNSLLNDIKDLAFDVLDRLINSTLMTHHFIHGPKKLSNSS